jgi:two-component system response regulator HydG
LNGASFIRGGLQWRSEGHLVHEAGTGEEALAILASHDLEVMLVDLKMEPMDGLTLLQKALEISPRLPVIVMTAFGSIDSAIEATRGGAYDYLTKPFKEAVLRHRVGLALDRARLHRMIFVLTDPCS